MVQNMIASKYLATYEQQVMHWRKSLANVADVMQLFQEIQGTWAYLEVLFIGSEVYLCCDMIQRLFERL